ncbi:negative cofactor 2 transcription regulator complex subunit BUR6 [Rhodotorula paludigena]|uniref:negative cofactor 2 transcription regulator complex subunit BUR6 n=1 Tax=Rhodotorula paludigena TaxID=86838 RepID=UPI00317D5097
MGKKSNQARFPLARIKKMIQADEDVGKVAQATPIVVSKALELFLASLVDACVKDADARGSKKLTPYGLKRAVTQTPMLDFCADIVESVPDPLEGEDEDGDEGAGKKKRKPRATPAAAAPKKAKKAAKVKDEDDEEEEGEPEDDKPQKKAPKWEDEDDYEE